jgi:hypothetical protein
MAIFTFHSLAMDNSDDITTENDGSSEEMVLVILIGCVGDQSGWWGSY